MAGMETKDIAKRVLPLNMAMALEDQPVHGALLQSAFSHVVDALRKLITEIDSTQADYQELMAADLRKVFEDATARTARVKKTLDDAIATRRALLPRKRGRKLSLG